MPSIGSENTGGYTTDRVPSRFKIPLAAPCLCGNAHRYVQQALQSGELGYGPFIPRLEAVVAERVGRRYGVVVSSGTAALHLALLAAGVGAGDLVAVPTLTFVATANAVRYCGAQPYFIDVYRDTGCIDDFRYGASIAYNVPRVKAVVPVGLLGQPLELYGFPAYLKARGISIIEDAAQALGAMDAGRLGLASCFSFNSNKIVTAAGGGIVVTDEPELADQVRHRSDQCRDRRYPEEYRHTDLGYNYRMSNLQAAVGLAQMEKLDEHLERKRAMHRQYREGLAALRGLTLWPRENPLSSHWLTAVQTTDRDSLLQHLRGCSIEAQALYTPLHRQPDFFDRPSQYVGRDVALDLWKTTVLLPSGCALTDAQIAEVVQEVRRWAEGPNEHQ